MPPLGRYIAKVYGSEPDGRAPGDRFFNPVERGMYRLLRVDPDSEQRWTAYALSLVAFSLVSVVAALRHHAPAGAPAVQSHERDGGEPAPVVRHER